MAGELRRGRSLEGRIKCMNGYCLHPGFVRFNIRGTSYSIGEQTRTPVNAVPTQNPHVGVETGWPGASVFGKQYPMAFELEAGCLTIERRARLAGACRSCCTCLLGMVQQGCSAFVNSIYTILFEQLSQL